MGKGSLESVWRWNINWDIYVFMFNGGIFNMVIDSHSKFLEYEASRKSRACDGNEPFYRTPAHNLK